MLPNGSVAAHWGNATTSWSIVFRRLLKDDEIPDFQSMLLLSSKRVTESKDAEVWSLEPSSRFSVKSRLIYLSPSSLLDKATYKALRKTSSPRRVIILIWMMAFGLLNCSLIMQRKIVNKCLLPSVCPLYLKNSEDLLHLFILCPYSTNCWRSILSIFNVVWAFDRSLS